MRNFSGFLKSAVRLLNTLPPNTRVNFTHLQPNYKPVFLPASIDRRINPKRWDDSIQGIHDTVTRRLNTFATCAANALKYNHRNIPAGINLVAFAEFDMRQPGFSGVFPVEIFLQPDQFLLHARSDVNSNPVAFEEVVVQTIARRIDHHIRALTSPEERVRTAVLVPIPIGLRSEPGHISFSPILATPIVNVCVVIIYDDHGALDSYSFTSKQTVSSIDYPAPLHKSFIQRILSRGIAQNSFEFVPLTNRLLESHQTYGIGVPAWEMPGTGFADLKYDPTNPKRLGQPIIPVPWGPVSSIMLQICMDYGRNLVGDSYPETTAPISVVVGHGIPNEGHAGTSPEGVLWKVEGMAGEKISGPAGPAFYRVAQSSLKVATKDPHLGSSVKQEQYSINFKDPDTVKPDVTSLDPEIRSATSSVLTYEVPK